METNEFINIKRIIKQSIESNLIEDLIHITKYEQTSQSKLIKEFQENLCSSFRLNMPFIEWSREKRIDEKYRDSVDIYGKNNEHHIVIELDRPRADQVAKKFLSRFHIL